MIVVHALALTWLLSVLIVTAIVIHECRRERRVEARRRREDEEVAELDALWKLVA